MTSNNPLIKEKEIHEIINYLNTKYNIIDKLFNDKISWFLILNNRNKFFNSESVLIKESDKAYGHVFLYRMKQRAKISPIAVLFHEIGHLIHTKQFPEYFVAPDKVINYLKELCFPELDKLSKEDQREIFTDVLMCGMMYESEYQQYSPFQHFHQDDLKIFSELTELVLNNPEKLV